VIPDMEKIVGDYLRADDDVTALGAKVTGRRLGTSTVPWVLVTQLDVRDVGHGLEHFTDHLLQLDCYAGKTATQNEDGAAVATDLGRTCRAVLHAMTRAADLDVTVAAVTFVGMARIPDTDLEPAMERVILSVELRVHP